MSRILGIDYGEKRVGVALSDETKTIAVPLAVLPNDRTLFREIKAICDARAIEAVVMGESKNFKGENNPIMKQITFFKAELERDLKLRVFLEPEFMTSAQAAQNPAGGENMTGAIASPLIDASAAALILQSFLDKKKRGKISAK